MTILKSSFNEEELLARWDDRIEPARFAGNDDVMDLAFYGKRIEKRIKLMRRSGVSREAFSPVFRGKIVGTSEGSEIRGYFSKSVVNYIFTSIALALVYFIYETVKQREAPLTAINILVLVSLTMVFLFLHTWKRTKKHYIDFLSEIL